MEERRSFTAEELALAKSVDLTAVAASLGYTVKKIGRYHTLKEMDSIRIYNRTNWFRWSRDSSCGRRRNGRNHTAPRQLKDARDCGHRCSGRHYPCKERHGICTGIPAAGFLNHELGIKGDRSRGYDGGHFHGSYLSRLLRKTAAGKGRAGCPFPERKEVRIKWIFSS